MQILLGKRLFVFINIYIHIILYNLCEYELKIYIFRPWYFDNKSITIGSDVLLYTNNDSYIFYDVNVC